MEKADGDRNRKDPHRDVLSIQREQELIRQRMLKQLGTHFRHLRILLYPFQVVEVVKIGDNVVFNLTSLYFRSEL